MSCLRLLHFNQRQLSPQVWQIPFSVQGYFVVTYYSAQFVGVFHTAGTNVPFEQSFFSFLYKFGVGEYQFFFGVQEQSCKVPVNAHTPFKEFNIQVVLR